MNMSDIDTMRGVLDAYGMNLDDEGYFLKKDGKPNIVKAFRKGPRVVVINTGTGKRLYSGPFPQGIGNFVEMFWYKEKIK